MKSVPFKFKSRFLTAGQLGTLANSLKLSPEELTARGGYIPHTDKVGAPILKGTDQLYARTLGAAIEYQDPTDEMEVLIGGQPASKNVQDWFKALTVGGIKNYIYDNFVSFYLPVGDHSLEKIALDALSNVDSSGAIFSKETIKLAITLCGNYFAAKFAPNDKRAYFEAAAKGKFTLEILVKTFGQAVNSPEMLNKFIGYITEFGEAAAQGFPLNGEAQLSEEDAENVAEIALSWVSNIQAGMEAKVIADPLDGL